MWYKYLMHFFALLFTVFIDSLGFGLVFPIFSPLIVNNEGGIFSPEVSLAMRGLIFGLLVSAYCFGVFFGGPVLGAVSDRIGRKKLLVGAMWMAFIGYIAACFGVAFQILWILFVARVLGGISAGSFAVAQSVIADISNAENKTKNFGLVGTAYWTGFVIGPFMGGKLASYGFTIPFAIAGFFCLLNALLLQFKFKESFTRIVNTKINWFYGISQIRKAFSFGGLRGIFTVMFISCVGWGFFTEFSPIFLNRYLGYQIGQIANFYAWIGLWIAFSQGLLIRPLLRWISPQRLLAVGLLGLCVVLAVMFKFNQNVDLLWFIPFIAFFQAFIFPSAATLVSNLGTPETQGEILGIHNAVQSAAIAIPPLFSGSLVALYPHLPVTVGSVSMLIAFVVFMIVSRSLQKTSLLKPEENNLE